MSTTDKGTQMKIVANRKSLVSALSLACQAVPTKAHKDVLLNVLITADPNRSTLYGTDFDIVVKAEFEAKVESPGSVLAPARLLLAMLRELPDEWVLLDTKEQILRVRGESSKHELPTAKTDEFPALPDPKWRASMEVPAAAFAKSIKAVLPQADETHAQYQLNCVFLDIGNGRAAVVASDGRVVAAAEMPVDSGIEATALIPRRASRLLSGIESDSQATVSVAESWLSLRMDGCEVMARLGEGRYFRWRDAIPNSLRPQFTASISPSVLLSCIRRTCIAEPDTLRGPRLSMAFGDGDLTLTYSVDGKQSDSRIPCASEGKLDSVFNFRFLIDVLVAFSLFGDEPVEIKSNGDEDPLLLTRGELTCLVFAFNKDS